MIRKSLQEEIGKILLPGQVRYNERLDRHCSFRTGGPADALVFVRTAGELAALLALLGAEGTEYFILGRGTNLLIGDGGYRGVIITPHFPSGAGGSGTEALRTGNSGAKTTGAEASGTGSSGAKISGRETSGNSTETGAAGRPEDWYEELLAEDMPFPLNGIRILEGGRIFAGAGVALQAVSAAAVEQGLSGLEFASGIPGTVGGALVMNAGAYDGEIKQTVTAVAGNVHRAGPRLLPARRHLPHSRNQLGQQCTEPPLAIWVENQGPALKLLPGVNTYHDCLHFIGPSRSPARPGSVARRSAWALMTATVCSGCSMLSHQG